MKEVKDGYFNYLTEEIFKAIYKANRYNCKDFELLKLELLLNLKKFLESRDIYNENISVLRNNERQNKLK
jgi:hypothetical protein